VLLGCGEKKNGYREGQAGSVANEVARLKGIRVELVDEVVILMLDDTPL
jgi:hypothetical protein